ncbi:Rha family transcriptional regulator [Maridesulfovibrio sp.]|uniref:Rha family transcriptional regulator n=1 Tax=Maridesulfovibrio sp. TaxID=2795000 RepID=UPI0039EE1721
MSTNISKININACESVQYEIDNWAIIRGLSSKEHGKLYLCEDINNVFEEPAHATHSAESGGNVLFFYDEQTVRKMLMDSGKEEYMDYLDIEEESTNLPDLVTLENGVPMTTSLKVAEVFGKKHKNIIRDIENLDCSSAFFKLNFERNEYDVKVGFGVKKAPMYRVTRDGFVFLAMGFTGKRAAQFKEQYINAFNMMEKRLIELEQKNTVALPDFTDPVAAARAWADQVEKRQALEAENKKLAPKADVFDATFAKQMTPLQGVVRKLRGVNTMKIKSDLLNAGYFYKKRGVYRVYSRYRDKEFVEKFDPKYNRTEIFALGKGEERITELYSAGLLTMKKDY